MSRKTGAHGCSLSRRSNDRPWRLSPGRRCAEVSSCHSVGAKAGVRMGSLPGVLVRAFLGVGAVEAGLQGQLLLAGFAAQAALAGQRRFLGLGLL